MLTWLESRSKAAHGSRYIHQRYSSIFCLKSCENAHLGKTLPPVSILLYSASGFLYLDLLPLSLNPLPKYSKIFCPHQWWRTFLSLFSSPFRCFIIMLTGVSCVVYCFQPESRVSCCIPSFLPPGFFSRDYDGPGFCHSSESSARDQYLLRQFFSTEFFNSNCSDKYSS